MRKNNRNRTAVVLLVLGLPGLCLRSECESTNSILDAVGVDMGISEVRFFSPATGIADTE